MREALEEMENLGAMEEMKVVTDDEKKNKKSSKRKKDIRSLIILSCICILMLGSATYAWFTVNNTPKVTNMALVAGAVGNLEIANTAGGTYGQELNLNTVGAGDNNTDSADMTNVVLNPSTTNDGIRFYKPVYNGDTQGVDSVEQITDSASLTKNYIYQKTFYLKASEGQAGSGNNEYDIFFVNKNTFMKDEDSTTPGAARAVRISFEVLDGASRIATVIYEPNCDSHLATSTKAVNSVTGYGNSAYGSGTGFHPQNQNGTFVDGGTNQSKKLFTIQQDKEYKVVMRVWLEGMDDDCGNEVSANNITGQFQFMSALASN